MIRFVSSFLTFCAIILVVISAPLSAQQLPVPHQNDLFKGITLYENGQYTHAVDVLKRFLSESKNEVQRKNAAYFLALSQAANEPQLSELFFEHFIAQFPETELSGLLFIDLAHRSAYDGDLAGATHYYDRALSLSLNEFTRAQVLYWNAETNASMRNYDRAHHYYQMLSAEHPRSEWAPRAMFNQGRLYLVQERYDAATEIFEQLRQRYPADMVVRRIGTALGQAYYQQARYQEAIESLRRVLASSEKEQETKAVLLIAESYSYLDELNEAATWYRRYISLTEGTPEERFAHYGLGWVFHKQGVYHWAAESFSKVGGEDELARKALYYQAVNHKLSGRYELALESFQTFGRTYTSGPWVEKAYYEWAIISFEIGDYVSAIENNLHLIRSGMELENPGQVYALLGEAYFANGEYGRAIESFERAEQFGASEEGVQVQARFQRAWVMYRNQAYREAQTIFEQVYQSNPTGDLAGEALFWSADSYFNLEEYGPASARFQRFLAEFRDHEFAGAARYSLGWSYFNLGQFEQAIQPFRQFLNDYQAPPIALFPYDVDTRLRLGDSHFALARYDDAIDFYERALASEQGADYAKFQIGNSYYRGEQTFESVRTFRQLIVDYPESTLREQAQYNIGYIFLLAGNYTQSVREFELMLELFPNSRWAPRAQYNIGNAYYNAGDNGNAIAAYRKLLERYPRSDLIIEAINGIQFAQEAAGLTDSSTDILEEFLDENPQAGTADRLRFRQAERLLLTGDLDGAIAAFQQYIRISNSPAMIAQAWYHLGEAYERKGNREEAKNSYRTIISEFASSNRNASALSSLGRIFLAEKNYQEAMQNYDALSKAGNQHRFEANIGMGNAALGLNRFEQAKTYYETAQSLGGDIDLVNLGLGKVALVTNRLPKALELLSAVAERSNTESGAEAQYLAGTIYQQQRNHEAAIRSFANVRLFFGGYSEWVVKSMLGSVRSNIAVGNRTEADRIIDLILKDYPGSTEATEARGLKTN